MHLSKEDATVELVIDPSFRGVMHGMVNDESDGCVLKGVCNVHVHRQLKARSLIVSFLGRTKVNLRGHNSVGMASSETVESRPLISRNVYCFKQEERPKVLQAGKHSYPFSFDLPAHLPASFQGKHGYIRYKLQAKLSRSTVFSGDIHTHQEITLRRNLMNELGPMVDITDTVSDENTVEQIKYSATASTMAFREGGIIHLDVKVHLGKPEVQAVRSVTCALREEINYRTTGLRSIACQIARKQVETYPLGWSTVYPSQMQDYNAHGEHSYNAIFRLCPRINGDTQSRLLSVSHSLVVHVTVEKRCLFSQEASAAQEQCENRPNQEDGIPTPPSSRPNTPPLNRNSSSSSLSSIFSILRHHDQEKQGITVCSLSLPLIVTSREQVWDGDLPMPPAYEQKEAPPSYFHTLEQLPAVPSYASSPTTY